MVDVPDISIVVPVYGSDGTLLKLYERVVEAAFLVLLWITIN